MNTQLAAALATAVISAFVAPSHAQAQVTPAAGTVAAPALSEGPVVPGVCMISREAIFANAKVGQSASARLKQLADAAETEVESDRKPLDAEIKAFQAEAPKLPEAQRRARELALSAKLQPVQAKAALRGREIEATRTKVMGRIADAAQPVIAQVFKQRACGLLLDRNTVLAGNMTNDLTPAVVQGLDAKISTIPFERETLPPQASGAPAR
ncbi:OmpH family outer membrane protein [Caulobacter sp.]|uniref:OmpH family outer membrane protein n=1 Tax=Caulobacter sp. TaxID=78 RepID=UPI003BAEDAE2